ncbi:hypothetical protein QJS10_CPA09g01666 [Acorus calamus]|uniref:Uncharacterized protein n=1 Tax=Acorus calamus TaxID=4465 RepID=A0AAV9E5A9_ACOCL|nr:hypothetical protein QJS10_CPA09g01666 [Acorus calamus]
MYAETAYNLHPFLEYFEHLTYPFLGFIGPPELVPDGLFLHGIPRGGEEEGMASLLPFPCCDGNAAK